MASKCPKCQTVNPESARFCLDCGTRIGGHVPDSPESSANRQSPAEKPPQAQEVSSTAPKDRISFTKTLETTPYELTRGTIFAGRYEIIEELGAGGMGRVYRVHDTKLNEEVALKLIKPEIAAERRVVERFQNEIKIARKIRHKNVCGMYDFHEEGRTLFLTMEYVRGEDLRSVIHRMKVLSVGTAVSIARQVAEGLGEAHKLGIIHRDLKPGNIMIDKDGQAKIMDFGIARAKQEKGITRDGAIIGTPEYMSPEQVEGREADPRSDIYALGVILFEMVVGSPPFEGETPFSIANKHKTEPPPIPKKLLPQIPEGLNRLILRCLEKSLANRYQTAGELVADLTALEQALPTTDRGLTRAKTKIRTAHEITVKLTPLKLILPVAIIVILAVAIVVALSLFRPHPGKIDSLAVLPLEALSIPKEEDYPIDGIHEELISELNRIPNINITPRQNVLRYKESQQTISEIARELKVAGIVQGTVIQAKDMIRIAVKLFDGRNGRQIWGPPPFDRDKTDIRILYSELALTIAREIKAQLTAQDKINLSSNRKVHPKAYNLYAQANLLLDARTDTPGDWAPNFKKALDLYQKSVEIDPAFALGYAALASQYGLSAFNGSLPKDEFFKKAKDMAMRSVSLDDSLSEAHAALGHILFTYEWDFPGAEKEFQRALELGPQGTRTSYSVLVNYLVLVGRFDEAVAIIKRAIDSNPLAPDYASLSWALSYAGRNDEAIAAAKKCIELNLNVTWARYQLMTLYGAKGMCAEAIAELKKYAADSGAASELMGAVYALCGDRKKAEEMIENIKKKPDFDPSVLAYIYAPLGDKDAAFAALQKGYEQRSLGMLYLKADPLFSQLRDDPRFIALLKKVGFEK